MGVFNGNPGQSAKLNVCQSAFAAKSPSLMSAKCTTPMVYVGLFGYSSLIIQYQVVI